MNGRSFALLGAGEFEPWHDEVDAWLLERANGSGRVLILPTASAPEGDDVFDRWGAMGLAHYGRLGVEAEVLAMKTREDAERPELVDRLADASMVFFSGGNPWYLATVMRDTAFCHAMFERIDDGLAYAGCSAGVACLTERTFDSDTQDFEQVFKPGLGYVRRALFGPHWDIVDTWIPGATELIVSTVLDGEVFVGIDERTAMMGDGTDWRVAGVSRVHVRRDGAWTTHAGGATFELPLEIRH
jgi:cyanophycinase-like exopeptidase